MNERWSRTTCYVALIAVLAGLAWLLSAARALVATRALSAVDLVVSLALSTMVLWGVEFKKWIMQRRRES